MHVWCHLVTSSAEVEGFSSAWCMKQNSCHNLTWLDWWDNEGVWKHAARLQNTHFSRPLFARPDTLPCFFFFPALKPLFLTDAFMSKQSGRWLNTWLNSWGVFPTGIRHQSSPVVPAANALQNARVGWGFVQDPAWSPWEKKMMMNLSGTQSLIKKN